MQLLIILPQLHMSTQRRNSNDQLTGTEIMNESEMNQK